jgi:rsbT co-antagonist protein RsbR
MSPSAQAITEQTVMANVGITEADLARRKQFIGLGPEDEQRLAAIRGLITRHVDELTKVFFDHLARISEAKVLLGYHDLTEQARTLKRAHLIEMVSGRYDLAYAEQRIRLGLLYSRVGLATKVFVGAFQRVVACAGEIIMKDAKDPDEGFQRFVSFQKIAFFDVGLHTDVLIHEGERMIRELSTPVLQIRERMLLLPLIGVIDTHRAVMVTENLLRAIRAARARVVVIDVTGVATIDTKVASHLVQTVSASRLMGAHTIITGISADVAQSMVSLGVELAPFTTVGDLQTGLEDAERLLGYRTVKAE